MLAASGLAVSVPCLAQTKTSGDVSPHRKLPRVTQILTWNAEGGTRVVMEVEGQVEYVGRRIGNPDRIYFDLRNAKLSPKLAAKTVEVPSGGDLLKAVRVAQNQAEVVRVVLEISKVKDYSVSLLPNPYRLVVNLYGVPAVSARTVPDPVPDSTSAPARASNVPHPDLASPRESAAPKAAAGTARPIRSRSRSASHSGETPMGPLAVSPVNPRYFTNPGGKAVYLTGSHASWGLQDDAWGELFTFDFDAYLDFLTSNNHNLIRMWMVEHTRFDNSIPEAIAHPMIYKRTGPGEALDGQPKFDLGQFDEEYFDRLRSRVLAAQARGIYVAVMLFQGWSIQDNGIGDPWPFHPFHAGNNVNDVNGDPSGHGHGKAVHMLPDPDITALQEAYARQVIDTLNDLDNVLWEISNESPWDSRDWHYHFIDFIHNYEATKPAQHPVLMTVPLEGSNEDLFASPAEAISPNDEGDYRGEGDGPPAADGSKVIIPDTDHLFREGGGPEWVWKSFTRGLNPIFLDSEVQTGGDSEWGPIRQAMGDTRAWADRMDLINMTPRGDLSSTGYALANPGIEYLIYAPDGGSVTVDVSGASGRLALLWFNPTTGEEIDGGTVLGGAEISPEAPFSGPAVLYILRQEEAPLERHSPLRPR